MNDQWGWNRIAKKCGSSWGHVGQSGSEVGLSRCKVDHHEFFFIYVFFFILFFLYLFAFYFTNLKD